MRIRSSLAGAVPRLGPEWTHAVAADMSGTDPEASPFAEEGATPDSSAATPSVAGGNEEAIRALHATLIVRCFCPGKVAVVVVSTLDDPEHGSRLLGALAETSAGLGYRVLLADADLGRAGASERGGEGYGFAALLDTRDNRPPPLQQTGTPGLFMLPAGRALPSSSAVLEHGRAVPRLRAVAAKFDIVFVDAGGLDAEATAALASGADGALLLLRRHRTQLRRVRIHADRLRERGVDILGVALI